MQKGEILVNFIHFIYLRTLYSIFRLDSLFIYRNDMRTPFPQEKTQE